MRRRTFIAGLGAAAWPVMARGQQAGMPVIGYLSGLSEAGTMSTATAFRRGLFEQGYDEGRTVEILYRSADGHYDRLPELAAELVKRRVAVVFASVPALTVIAARSATAAIPIVFANGADPVELGFVASLNRPGGNITGVNFLVIAMTAKRLEVLRQIAPAGLSVGFLINPANSTAVAQVKEAKAAADILGVRLIVLNATTSAEIEMTFAGLAGQKIGAVLGGADALLFSERDLIARLAAQYGVPALFELREFVEAGGLISYGPRIADAYRIAGTYAGRILKGEKPADLPVQQSTKVELLVNLKAGRALGITFPPDLLALADEVIE
jgi:putative ABC transport system substrate-binding protein